MIFFNKKTLKWKRVDKGNKYYLLHMKWEENSEIKLFFLLLPPPNYHAISVPF